MNATIKSEKDIIELLKTHSDSERIYIKESEETMSISELLFFYDDQELTIEFEA